MSDHVLLKSNELRNPPPPAGSVVVDSLLNVPSIVCAGSVYVPCFVMHNFVSFLVLQSS